MIQNSHELAFLVNRGTEEADLVVFLIMQDLRIHKLFNTLRLIGLEDPYCEPDISLAVLRLCGYKGELDDIYALYLHMINYYCDRVSCFASERLTEARVIYRVLNRELALYNDAGQYAGRDNAKVDFLKTDDESLQSVQS